MKRFFNKNFLVKVLLVTAIVLFVPHFVMAAEKSAIQTIASMIIPTDITDGFIYGTLSLIGNAFLALSAYLVALAGSFLGVAMTITLKIGDFYKSMPIIDDVWRIIRNISSIGIIFILLYSSIRIILGDGTGDTKKLIKNIVIAGLLINFSLFFVRVAIDASNVVALQFYKAIAPNTSENISTGKIFSDGGISNVMMGALKVQRIYLGNDALKASSAGSISLNIFVISAFGIILMLSTAFSLLGAAIAVTARTGILLFCMAVSPLYFVAMIFPKAGGQSKKYYDLFKSQLFFMPVYLFLMYIAISFIASDGFKSAFSGGNNDATSLLSVNGSVPNIIAIVSQYIVALIFINIPLIAALKLGAVGASWVPNSKAISGWLGKGIWRNTGSRIASSVAESNTLRTFAASSAVGAGALQGLRSVAKPFNENVKKIAESKTAFGESLGYNKNIVAKSEFELKKLKQNIMDEDLIINSRDSSVTFKEKQQAEKRKKEYKEQVKELEKGVKEEKRRRQESYAERLDPRDIDTETGKLKSMRPIDWVRKGRWVNTTERVASAQIHIKNLESDLKQEEEDLTDHKKKKETLENDIKRAEKKKNSGNWNDSEERDLNNTKDKLVELNEKDIVPTQKRISDFKNELSRYKEMK